MTGESTWLTGLLPASYTALARWEAAEVVLRFWPGAMHRVVKFCYSGYLMAARLVICGATASLHAGRSEPAR